VYVCYCLQCFDAVGWAGGRASGLLKTEWWGAGMVIYLERDADLHMAQLMPLPLTFSCFSKIQIGFTFLLPAHPGGPRKRAVKRVCVCVMSVSDVFLFTVLQNFSHSAESNLLKWSPVWARGRCRIRPPCFLAECCKRQLNQVSFVLLYFRLSAFSNLY